MRAEIRVASTKLTVSNMVAGESKIQFRHFIPVFDTWVMSGEYASDQPFQHINDIDNKVQATRSAIVYKVILCH